MDFKQSVLLKKTFTQFMTLEEQQIIASYGSGIHNNIISLVLVTLTGFGTYSFLDDPPFCMQRIANKLLVLGVSMLGIFIATHILLYGISEMLAFEIFSLLDYNLYLLDRAKAWTHSQITLLTCLIIAFIALTWSTIVYVSFLLIQDQIAFISIEPEVPGELDAIVETSIKKKQLPLFYMVNWGLIICVSLLHFPHSTASFCYFRDF